MKKINCYNCESSNKKFYAEENGFTLVKCMDCGLLYVEDPPDQEQIIKSVIHGVHQGKSELHVSGRFTKSKIRQYLTILNDIYSCGFGNIKTWIDIGCGHGEFILALQTASLGNISIIGLEPNVEKQVSAKRRGSNVTFFDIEKHDMLYDSVSMLDVYSHLLNPKNFISSLKKLLAPQGEILIQTGDSADLSAKDQFKPFCLPDHLSFASERIIINILKQLNFEILSIKKYPYFTLNFITLSKEILKLFLPEYNSNLKYLINKDKYSHLNMFIRARLISRK